MKNKSHIIISIDTEKELDKFQHLLMIKTLEVNAQEKYLNLIKVYMKNT